MKSMADLPIVFPPQLPTGLFNPATIIIIHLDFFLYLLRETNSLLREKTSLLMELA